MGNTVLYIATSLDGFIAGKDDDISWLFEYNDADYGYNEFFSGVGAVIQGRRSYDIEVRNGWEYPVPTFVLSHSMPKQPPQRSDVFFTHGDIAEVLQRARQMTGKNIWIEGGANVARQFLSRGLIDEIALFVVPVILGAGIRLFDDVGVRIPLLLANVKQFEKGLVQLLYKPKKQP